MRVQRSYANVDEMRRDEDARRKPNDKTLREICPPEHLEHYERATSGIDPTEPSEEQLARD